MFVSLRMARGVSLSCAAWLSLRLPAPVLLLLLLLELLLLRGVMPLMSALLLTVSRPEPELILDKRKLLGVTQKRGGIFHGQPAV
jgi:hypothetical protein